MTRILLRLLTGLQSLILGTSVLTAATFATYSIWDNYQVYQSATDVQNEIRLLKPEEETATGTGPSFKELQEINPDVVGWITVEGTNIDYPVVQGENNLEYMNKDVYGEFSLAGSIFLDSRNSSDFSDRYNLIYGHNMDQHLMFGDLALFKDEDFFTKHTKGELMIPGDTWGYTVVAIQQVSAGTDEIFNPGRWKTDMSGMAEYIVNSSLLYNPNMVALIKNYPTRVQVLALVTCSSGSTNDRTVLILVRILPGKDDPVPPGGNTPGGSTGGGTVQHGSAPPQTGDTSNPNYWITMIVITLAVIATVEGAEAVARRKRSEI